MMLRPEPQAPAWWATIILLVIGIPFVLAFAPVLLATLPALALGLIVHIVSKRGLQ